MVNQSFAKHERLLKRSQFTTIMAQGQKKRVDNLCTLFYLPNGRDHQRLGVIVSKKVGNAVIRNRAKRRIREIFRRHKPVGPVGLDVVVVSGRALVPLPYALLEKKLVNSLQKMK